MAGYECSLCGGAEPATVLITPLTGGETMPVGESCMAVAFTGMLAGHLQVDPELLWDAVVAAQGMAAREHPDGTPKDQPVLVGDPGDPDVARSQPPVAVATPAPAKRGPGRPRKPRATAARQGGSQPDSVFIRVPHGTPDDDDSLAGDGPGPEGTARGKPAAGGAKGGEG